MHKVMDVFWRKLRQATYYWKPREEALKKAKVTEGEYTIKIPGDKSRTKIQCAHCKGIFRLKEIKRDHIDPIVPLEGFDESNIEVWRKVIIPRFFPNVDGWQILCKECHKQKTKEENKLRPSCVSNRKKNNK